MWGAIIQAIDHAMGRTQKGMSAGIDVANSQHGGAAGAATTSNEQVDTSKTGENIKSVASEAAKQKLNAQQINGSAGSGASEGVGAADSKGADVLPKGAGADAAAGSGALPEGASAAGSILSDEKAKESKSVSAKTAATNTVSGWKKARNYGTKDFKAESTNIKKSK